MNKKVQVFQRAFQNKEPAFVKRSEQMVYKRQQMLKWLLKERERLNNPDAPNSVEMKIRERNDLKIWMETSSISRKGRHN